MHARLAQRQHRDIGDLAGGLQAGVADVADEERVVALTRRRLDVFEDFAGLEIVEVMKLGGGAADLFDAVHVDFRAGIFHRFENAAQRLVVVAPRVLARHALVPQLHSDPPRSETVTTKGDEMRVTIKGDD
jgi:hypothetical protein